MTQAILDISVASLRFLQNNSNRDILVYDLSYLLPLSCDAYLATALLH